MRDQDLDRLMKDAVETYNAPMEIPRERMWERIDAARANRRGLRAGNLPRRLLRHPAFIWPLTAAALLVMGVGIGRYSRDGDLPPVTSPAPVVMADPDQTGKLSDRSVYTPLTNAVFAKAEALLTNVCSDGGVDDPENPMQAWAGNLLIQTRLLLDAPVTSTMEVKGLLQDLELVLTQIIQANASSGGNQCDWIIDGMEQRATLARLRNRNHAGRSPAGI